MLSTESGIPGTPYNSEITTPKSPTRIVKSVDIKNKSTFYPVETQGHHLRTFINTVQEKLQQLKPSVPSKASQHNLTTKERKALKELKNNKEIVIRAADKGGGVVIQDFTSYNQEATSILSDMDFYEVGQLDPFPKVEKKLYTLLKQALDTHQFLISHMCPDHCFTIYPSLDNLLGRSIILGVNSTTSNLSQYLDHFLQDYVKGSTQLPERLR